MTVLHSRTQPLIRYEMGDCLRSSTDGCPCGRVFRLVAGIEGRREDILSMDGVSVHPNVFHRALEPAPVASWQVEQVVGGVRVLVVEPQPGFDAEVLSASIRRELAAAGVASARVTVEAVAAIPKTPMGKTLLVRRR